MSTSARRWFDRGLIVSGTGRAGTPTSWSSPGHGDPTHVGLSRYSGSAAPRQLAQRAAHAGHWLQLADETRPGESIEPRAMLRGRDDQKEGGPEGEAA